MKSRMSVSGLLFAFVSLGLCLADSGKPANSAVSACKTNGVSGNFVSGSTQTFANADLVTSGGTVYKNYKVLRVENKEVVVMHSGGVVSVPASALPEDLQIKYNFKEAKKDVNIASSGADSGTAGFTKTIARQADKKAEEELRCLRKKARAGDVEAKHQLEMFYSKEIERLTPKAEHGDAEAQYRLGQCYDDSVGVTENPSLAMEWYRKAADQGYADAQYALGGKLFIRFLQSDSRNSESVVEWFRKAAEQGHANAQCALGFIYKKGLGVVANPELSMMWYQKAADQGDAQGQRIIGQHYALGIGVAKNYTLAAEWLRKAAMQEDAEAQYSLGLFYCLGLGVDKNSDLAVEWYRKDANQGSSDAQYRLGHSYWYGYGTVQNRELAVLWLNKAVKQGNKDAIEFLKGQGL